MSYSLFKPPKNKNMKNNKNINETQEKSEPLHKTEQQQLEIEQKETLTTRFIPINMAPYFLNGDLSKSSNSYRITVETRRGLYIQ